MPFEDFSLKGIIFLPLGGSIQPVFSLIGRGNISTVPRTGGITMEVKQIENFKIPNAVAHEITQEELQWIFRSTETAKLTKLNSGIAGSELHNRVS